MLSKLTNNLIAFQSSLTPDPMSDDCNLSKLVFVDVKPIGTETVFQIFLVF